MPVILLPDAQGGTAARSGLADGRRLSLIFRAFYGVPKTVLAPSGIPVNGIRGFLDYLSRFIVDRHPRHLVVATDEDWRPQFRVDAMPSYKSHRTAEPIPPELEVQMEPIMRVLAAVGIPALGAPGYEAEDVIASLAKKVRGKIEILSGDRDLFALVRDPDVRVLYPQSGGRLTIVDEAEITRKYGIPGRAYGDFAILRGDPSDGLPGLPGVGEKTAAAMIKRHGSIEGVLWDGNISKANAEYIRRALAVVMPVDSIPLEVPDAEVPAVPRDRGRLAELKQEFGLGGAVERLERALATRAARRLQAPGSLGTRVGRVRHRGVRRDIDLLRVVPVAEVLELPLGDVLDGVELLLGQVLGGVQLHRRQVLGHVDAADHGVELPDQPPDEGAAQEPE